MNSVTRILNDLNDSQDGRIEALLPLVYSELRKLAALKMAREPSDHTLQATALVHEAYVRLIESRNPNKFENSRHFFSAAAEAMRKRIQEFISSLEVLWEF